jgi:hypothetical protein
MQRGDPDSLTTACPVSAGPIHSFAHGDPCSAQLAQQPNDMAALLTAALLTAEDRRNTQ